MYYDNKQTFYVKQYGPAVIVSIISLLLIASGVFIYLKTTNVANPFAKNSEVAQAIDTKTEETTKTEEITKPEETTKTEEITKPEETTTNLTPVSNETTAVVNNALVDDKTANAETIKYFENLPAMTKSKDVNVVNINTSGSINIELDGYKLEVTLIGVDFKYSNELAIEKMKTDLLNKKVQIGFDTVRTENNITYVYLYCDDKLYNVELLKTGLVTLKTERKNIKLNSQLASAQAYARENSLGVWKK